MNEILLISSVIFIYGNFRNYVNDGVGFKLTPEQILYYSPYCYGTADAISLTFFI